MNPRTRRETTADGSGLLDESVTDGARQRYPDGTQEEARSLVPVITSFPQDRQRVSDYSGWKPRTRTNSQYQPTAESPVLSVVGQNRQMSQVDLHSLAGGASHEVFTSPAGLSMLHSSTNLPPFQSYLANDGGVLQFGEQGSDQPNNPYVSQMPDLESSGPYFNGGAHSDAGTVEPYVSPAGHRVSFAEGPYPMPDSQFAQHLQTVSPYAAPGPLPNLWYPPTTPAATSVDTRDRQEGLYSTVYPESSFRAIHKNLAMKARAMQSPKPLNLRHGCQI